MAQSQTVQSGPMSRAIALWEIASVLVSCLIAEWALLAFTGGNKVVLAVPVLLSLGLITISHRVYGETLKDIWFNFENFGPSLKTLILPTSIVFL